jgi:pimeloyl-ACP methyl ester carboxylesterase
VDNKIRHEHIVIQNTAFHIATSGPTVDHVTSSSRRKSVLCIHGFPEGWVGWRPLMRDMTDVTFIAPDLRGYPTTETPNNGYDVMTLTNDIDHLISALHLDKPILLSHDWGGALGWIYAHRFPERISQLVVINCPHPKTLVRAVLHFEDFQTLRIPWVPPFQVPYLPERLLTTKIGRKLLELSFTLREGSKGHMERDLVREIVNRFQHSSNMYGPVNYYREFVRTLLHTKSRKQLYAIYDKPIQVPVTLIWGLEDGALSAKVAQKSHLDAGCPVDWRPLEGIGHFVDLEASDLLAQELYRLPGLKIKKALTKFVDVTAA